MTTTRPSATTSSPYVKVSQLGELSERKEVTSIDKVRSVSESGLIAEHPGKASMPQRSDGGPELPYWLEGYDAPYEYANIKGILNHLLLLYLSGELTEDAREHYRGDGIATDDLNKFSVKVTYDPTITTGATLMDWITENGGLLGSERRI